MGLGIPAVSESYQPTVVVASADATPAMKRAADYVCTGTNDQVTIQAAIDFLEGEISDIGGGTVYLTPGYYDMQIGAASEQLHGNDDLKGYGTARVDSGRCHLQPPAADYAKISVGDVILVRSAALVANDSWGFFRVESKIDAHDAIPNEVELYSPIYSDYTVDWMRPSWSISLPKGISLEGAGKLVTIMRIPAPVPAGEQSLHSCVFLEAPEASTGFQELRKLSIQGGYNPSVLGSYGTNPDTDAIEESAWTSNGVLTSASYDAFIRDCEIRYFKGVGLVNTQGWGFQMSGGWIEDCEIDVYHTDGGHYTNVKIQQANRHAILTNGVKVTAPSFNNCEIQDQTAGQSVIKLVNMRYGVRFNNCELRFTANNTTMFEIASSNGLSGAVGVMVDNATINVDGCTGNILFNTDERVKGGRLTGQIVGVEGVVSAPKLFNGSDFYDYFMGFHVDISMANAEMLSTESCASQYGRSQSAINSSGGNWTTADYGQALVWDTGTLDGVVKSSATNAPNFAGVISRFAWNNGKRGNMYVAGPAPLYVDATTAIDIGDMLKVSSTAGAFEKADASGDVVVARALEAKASGTGVVKGELITPRPV